MELAKAIEILQLSKAPDFEGDSNDFYDAIALGIEAMKAIQYQRHTYHYYIPSVLPSEHISPDHFAFPILHPHP